MLSNEWNKAISQHTAIFMSRTALEVISLHKRGGGVGSDCHLFLNELVYFKLEEFILLIKIIGVTRIMYEMIFNTITYHICYSQTTCTKYNGVRRRCYRQHECKRGTCCCRNHQVHWIDTDTLSLWIKIWIGFYEYRIHDYKNVSVRSRSKTVVFRIIMVNDS